MAQIGLKNLFYAPITEDENGNETYGAPVRLAKMISANMSVTVDAATLYADDGADVDLRLFQNGTISFGINDLGTAAAAALLDQTVDANGVLVSSGEDNPPPVAIGFQSRSAKGGDRFFWLYRVTFGVPSAELNTKGESIEFATPTIEGTISRRNRPDANGKHPWKAEVKAGVQGVVQAVTDNWLNSVYEPGAASDTSLSALTIGSLALSPAFAAGTLEYTATASGASDAVTATANSGTAAVAITVNGASITNGDTYTWETGENVVKITVTDGYAATAYTVTVTKGA